MNTTYDFKTEYFSFRSSKISARSICVCREAKPWIYPRFCCGCNTEWRHDRDSPETWFNRMFRVYNLFARTVVRPAKQQSTNVAHSAQQYSWPNQGEIRFPSNNQGHRSKHQRFAKLCQQLLPVECGQPRGYTEQAPFRASEEELCTVQQGVQWQSAELFQR